MPFQTPKQAVPAAALLATAALALAGCGSAGSAGREALGPPERAVPMDPGRRCVYADSPEDLPSLDRVLGPSARGSLGLWGYGGDADDTIQVSIRYGPSGAVQWTRVIGEGMEPERAAELERLVGSAVPPDGKPDWGVRLVVTSDGTPVRVLPAVICEPLLLSRMPTPTPVGTPGQVAELRRARGRSAAVLIHLDDQGRILDAEVTRSSGSRLADEYILAMVRDTSFRPQLHDGFPVAAADTVRFDLDWR